MAEKKHITKEQGKVLGAAALGIAAVTAVAGAVTSAIERKERLEILEGARAEEEAQIRAAAERAAAQAAAAAEAEAPAAEEVPAEQAPAEQVPAEEAAPEAAAEPAAEPAQSAEAAG